MELMQNHSNHPYKDITCKKKKKKKKEYFASNRSSVKQDTQSLY